MQRNMHESEEDLWSYNCRDCYYTRQIGEASIRTIEQLGLGDPDTFQQALFWPVLSAMLRGVRVDIEAKAAFAVELEKEIASRQSFFKQALGHDFNPNSTLQMQSLFYKDLQITPVMTRATKGNPSRVTCNDAALEIIKQREPITRPLIKAIQEYRTLRVYLSTFINAPLDIDGRMRCSYNICGTETYRLSSSQNAFDSGMNLQNIPKRESMMVSDENDSDRLSLPNVRKLFIPDEGYTFFDLDLDRADLQVVVWEAGDEELKSVLREGIDMHCFNACGIFNIKGIPFDELKETHPNYKERRAQIGEAKRDKAKRGVHAVDYGVQERTLAVHLGSTVKEASNFIKGWFAAHPKMEEWHVRTRTQLEKYRFVENKFGYRRYYFDRIDGLLPEALAWVPQSTVANVINRGWIQLYNNYPEVEVLLQVHDSLAGQFPTNMTPVCMDSLREATRIVVPYDDPLIIPTGIKVSTESWGACK